MSLDHSSTSISKILIASLVGTCSAAYLYFQYRLKEADETSNDDEVVVPLLPLESSSLMMENIRSISSLTWYSGDIENIRQPLRERVRKILQANPWLTGHLATRQGKTSIVYKQDDSVSEEQLNRIFTVADNFKVSTSMTYRNLMERVEPLLVEKGNDLMKSTKPFFHVTVVPADNDKGFALITSLAHCVGDGHTYYNLHNMLSEDKPILSLNVNRKMEITQKIEDKLGGKAYASSFSPNAGFIFRFIRGIIASKFAGPESTKVKLFLIPEEWIQTQKVESKASSWISTNDIITSTFFNATDCDQAIMALNFRGKVKNCNSNDAGCYFEQLILRPSDYRSASQIREIVNEIKMNKRQPQTSPMTSFEHVTSKKQFGCISSWYGFAKPVKLKGCPDQVLHIPLLPTDAVSVPSRFTSGLFVFRPDKTKRVACLFAGHHEVLERLEASGMVGDDVQNLIQFWLG